MEFCQTICQDNYLSAEAPTGRSRGYLMIQRVRIRDVLLVDAEVGVHTVVAAPEQTQILHDYSCVDLI